MVRGMPCARTAEQTQKFTRPMRALKLKLNSRPDTTEAIPRGESRASPGKSARGHPLSLHNIYWKWTTRNMFDLENEGQSEGAQNPQRCWLTNVIPRTRSLSSNIVIVNIAIVGSCNCDARPNLAICCLLPVTIASVLMELRRKSFSGRQLVSALAQSHKRAGWSDKRRLIVVYCCVSSTHWW